jgi:hypothetical protein
MEIDVLNVRTIKCEMCGRSIETIRRDTRYCSASCRQRAHRQRERLLPYAPLPGARGDFQFLFAELQACCPEAARLVTRIRVKRGLPVAYDALLVALAVNYPYINETYSEHHELYVRNLPDYLKEQ